MQIQTTRFGVSTIDPDQIITFPRGLLGLGDCIRFVLLPGSGQGGFYWLQSTDMPEIAFLVVDPGLFFKDYSVPIREETQEQLNLADVTEGRTLVICNRLGEWLTGNLLGPLVINTRTRIAEQIVLTDKKWTCRQPLVRVGDSGVSAVARAA